MAFHFKSNKSFITIIGISAFAISIMAALFSIIGVSTLFSGEMKTIAMMMGVLELAKVILASYLAMYWKKLSKLLRTYFITAVIVLMVITSGGIFGYLSDAYQGTKGNYEQVDQSIKTDKIRENFYQKEIKENESRIAELRGMKRTYQLQIDSLIARNKSTSAVERALSYGDKEITDIRKKNTIMNDSISVIQLRMAEKEGINSAGKLGPLRYIATAFGTDMDTVVKYFILVLIFVFDPLAVLLFVSIATILRKDKEELSEPPKEGPMKKLYDELDKKGEQVLNELTQSRVDKPKFVDPKTGEYTLKFNEKVLTEDFWLGTPAPTTSSAETKKEEPYVLRKINMDQPPQPVEEQKTEQPEVPVEPPKKSEESSGGSPEVNITEIVVTASQPPPEPRKVTWHSANYRGPGRIY